MHEHNERSGDVDKQCMGVGRFLISCVCFCYAEGLGRVIEYSMSMVRSGMVMRVPSHERWMYQYRTAFNNAVSQKMGGYWVFAHECLALRQKSRSLEMS